MTKTWFVTGTSRGLGRSFVEAALSRGDRVAASARDVTSLDDLSPPGAARTRTRSTTATWPR